MIRTSVVREFPNHDLAVALNAELASLAAAGATITNISQPVVVARPPTHEITEVLVLIVYRDPATTETTP